MSRAWDKAKAGAAWLGKAGMVVGAIVGAVYGGVLFGVAGVIAGAIGGAIGGLVQGAMYGGAAGGVYGAVTDEPKEKVVVVQQQAPARAAAPVQDMAPEGPASTRFQTMVNESRVNTAPQR